LVAYPVIKGIGGREPVAKPVISKDRLFVFWRDHLTLQRVFVSMAVRR
jgi:hypothetical protein